MYEILKETIENTNYKLEEMLDKIYVLYAKNKLSKEEMDGCVWSPEVYPSAWQEVVESEG